MKIQSCSVDVPIIKGGKCINDCAFCVSKMKNLQYKNQMDCNMPFFDLYLNDYLKRLEYVRDNGCNTIILTGTCEPTQNRSFLSNFGMFMMMMDKPFRNIEMQTAGTLLDKEYLRFLRNHVGVNTISLSVSHLFDSDMNADINGTPQKFKVNILDLCRFIKEYDFNLRISINLNKFYNTVSYEEIFSYAKNILGADQITFRIMYSSGLETKQDLWIAQNKISDDWLYGSIESDVMGYNQSGGLYEYIEKNGKQVGVLDHGEKIYWINEMKTVIDGDCMGKKMSNDYKYLILRPNCKLYSSWDDPILEF